MSLDFDYREVNMENFPDVVIFEGEDKEQRYLNSTFQQVVWGMLAISMQSITPENVNEVWWRIDFYQRLSGGGNLTEKNVRDAIGLKTNVGEESRHEFKKFMVTRFDQYWHSKIVNSHDD